MQEQREYISENVAEKHYDFYKETYTDVCERLMEMRNLPTPNSTTMRDLELLKREYRFMENCNSVEDLEEKVLHPEFWADYLAIEMIQLGFGIKTVILMEDGGQYHLREEFRPEGYQDFSPRGYIFLSYEEDRHYKLLQHPEGKVFLRKKEVPSSVRRRVARNGFFSLIPGFIPGRNEGGGCARREYMEEKIMNIGNTQRATGDNQEPASLKATADSPSQDLGGCTDKEEGQMSHMPGEPQESPRDGDASFRPGADSREDLSPFLAKFSSFVSARPCADIPSSGAVPVSPTTCQDWEDFLKYLIRTTALYTDEVYPPPRIDKDNETLTQKLEAFIDELEDFSAAMRDIDPPPENQQSGEYDHTKLFLKHDAYFQYKHYMEEKARHPDEIDRVEPPYQDLPDFMREFEEFPRSGEKEELDSGVERIPTEGVAKYWAEFAQYVRGETHQCKAEEAGGKQKILQKRRRFLRY